MCPICDSSQPRAPPPVYLGVIEDIFLKKKKRMNSPLSVLGSATVTLTVQLSQHTSSSPLPPHMPIRRRPALVFSMNCTVTRPRPPPLPSLAPPPPTPSIAFACWGSEAGVDGAAEEGERARSETSEAVRWSMSVSSSGSAT